MKIVYEYFSVTNFWLRPDIWW